MVTDPTYVSVSSVRCPVTLGVRVDPFSSENGPAVWNDGLRGIEWSHDRFRRRFATIPFARPIQRTTCGGSSLFFAPMIITGYRDNAVILNGGLHSPMSGSGSSETTFRLGSISHANRSSFWGHDDHQVRLHGNHRHFGTTAVGRADQT